jgi:membrane protein implicated in regulation of membrane protease activity
MSMLLFWVAVGIAAAIIELLTPFFGFVFVTGAALAAGVVAALHLPFMVQVLVFGVALILLLWLVRPPIAARLAGSRGVPSRMERTTGLHGQVTEAIDPVLGTGRVTVAGEDWAARSHQAIPVGATVVVEGADGIVLQVAPLRASGDLTG